EIGGICHRYPDEVKSPVAHPLDMFFCGGTPRGGRIRRKEIQQVKALPSWQLVRRCRIRLCQRRGIGDRQSRPRKRGVSQKRSSLHVRRVLCNRGSCPTQE